MQLPRNAVGTNHHNSANQLQVLELVLPYVTDTKTMVATTSVSTEIKRHTHQAIKQNLPALVDACPLSSHQPTKAAPFQWLRSIAGPEWHRFETACALLRKATQSENQCQSLAAGFLVKTGERPCTADPAPPFYAMPCHPRSTVIASCHITLYVQSASANTHATQHSPARVCASLCRLPVDLLMYMQRLTC